MDFLSLSLRLADRSGVVYAPFGFETEVPDDERDLIAAAFAGHVPERVDAGFNEWHIWRGPDGRYMAKRATWDMGMYHADDAAGMAAKITEYYTR